MARSVEPPDFLSRALARAGVLPLAEAERAIREGRVKLAGRAVRQPLTTLRPGDEVRVDGRPVSLAARTRVWMLHKPVGCVTTASDPEGRRTVFDVLADGLSEPQRRFGWHAIGRLDLDTTGLLLFTNDERLVAFATAPASKLPRRYVARVQGEARDEALRPLREGLSHAGEPLRPARARIRDAHTVELTITEGKFHQVKKMLGAVGLPVLALHREAVGAVELDVPVGATRALTDEEIERGLGYPVREFHPRR
jgi:pseudouridine synthase